MLRWFPRLQVATACFSCSPPDLNFLNLYFIFMYMHYSHCHRVTAHLQWIIIIIIIVSNMTYRRQNRMNYVICLSSPKFLEGVVDVRKGKVHPRTSHEGPHGEEKFSCTSSLTSAQDGRGWSTLHPGHFVSGEETRYPLCSKLGGTQSRYGRVRKISLPPRFDPRTVRPVASRYTEYAVSVQ
jgi:hypothetical protein